MKRKVKKPTVYFNSNGVAIKDTKVNKRDTRIFEKVDKYMFLYSEFNYIGIN